MTLSLLALEKQPAQSLVVETACNRVPPLWPLQDFVAVNPFLGLSEIPFAEANELMAKVAHRDILMDAEYYLNQISSGAIRAADIRAAIAQVRSVIDPADPISWLSEQLKTADRSERILTVVSQMRSELDLVA